jgi:hypothetical protein
MKRYIALLKTSIPFHLQNDTLSSDLTYFDSIQFLIPCLSFWIYYQLTNPAPLTVSLLGIYVGSPYITFSMNSTTSFTMTPHHPFYLSLVQGSLNGSLVIASSHLTLHFFMLLLLFFNGFLVFIFLFILA